MKILHTADVQLGAQFKMLGARAELQREQIKKTFHEALEIGVKEEVGIVLISGDLFDSNHPSHDLVEFTKGEFAYLLGNNIQVCIVPGHHDPLDVHCIYKREQFGKNVFVFTNQEGEVKEYPKLDVAIFAKPNVSSTSTKSPLPQLSGSDPDSSKPRYKILAAHGDLQIPSKSAKNYHPIEISEIEKLDNIDYVALGHWHSMKDCSQYGKFKMPVWYSGSPELVALDQTGSGNVLIIDFTPESVDVKHIQVGKRQSVVIALDISAFSNIEDIKKKIAEASGPSAIIQVELSGLNTNNLMINTDRIEADFEDLVFYIRIIDKSHIVIKDIPEYSDNLIQGKFIKIMQKKLKEAPAEDKKIYEEALQIGLAELEGKEVV